MLLHMKSEIKTKFGGKRIFAILYHMEPHFAGNYIKKLAMRAKESRVYARHQAVGLEIAETLHDRTHKALYIKLAKKGDPDALLELAKTVAEKENVKNYGAYFMALLTKPHKSRAARKKS